jgi:hypothetical protein
MSLLGFFAYDARPVSVLMIGILVVVVMFLEFIVYGAHQFARSALHIWRTGVVINISQGFRGLVSGG